MLTWLTTVAVSNAVTATCLGGFAYFAGRRLPQVTLRHAVWILVLIELLAPPVIPVTVPILSVAFLQLCISLAPWLIGAWLCGIVACVTYRLYALGQMCRLMCHAAPHPRLDRAMFRVANAARVNNYPTVRVVPWVASPILWGLGTLSVIVFPKKLLDALGDADVETLLQHELAHYRRGDQWVRILEIVASTIFWWHPLVWWAMREIEIQEENCCDAWVVAQNRANRRRYAEALLTAVDFVLPGVHRALPVGTSRLARVPLIQQRLSAIMRGERQPMTMLGWTVLAIALCWTLIQPRFVPANGLDSPPENRRALIICGLPGDAEHAQQFSQTVERIYNSLTGRLGFAADDVRILFGHSEEVIPSFPFPVQGRGTREEIAAEANLLVELTRDTDTTWIFAIGHAHYDGKSVYFNVPDEDLNHLEFADLFTGLKDRLSLFFVCTPASGYFIEPLSGPRRIVVSATAADAEINGSLYHKALADALTSIDRAETSDWDKDGTVSLFDLYLQAARNLADQYRLNDPPLIATEHPQLDDNGDGRGSEIQLDFLTDSQGGRADKTDSRRANRFKDGSLAAATPLPLASAPGSSSAAKNTSK